MNPMERLFVAALACVMFLTGCATYRVQVRATRDDAPAAPSRKYILDLASSQVRSPQFLSAVRAVQTALAHRGYQPVGRRADAAVVIAFAVRTDLIGHEVSYHSVSRDVISGPVSLTPRPALAAPVATREVSLAQGREGRYHVAISLTARDERTDRGLWRVDAEAVIAAADRDDIIYYLIAAAEPSLDPVANRSGEVALEHGHASVRALREGT